MPTEMDYKSPARDYLTPKSPARDYLTPSGRGGREANWEAFSSSTSMVTPGGGMSNVDFKKMMMTPRRAEETAVPDYFTRKRKNKEGKRIDTDDVFAQPKAKKAKEEEPRTKNPVFVRRRKAETDYRDRAAERAQGANPDYLDDEKMLREVGLPVPAERPTSSSLAIPSQTPVPAAYRIGGAKFEAPAYTPVSYTPAMGATTAVTIGQGITRISSTTVPSAALAAAAAAEGEVPGLAPESVQLQRNKEIREMIDKSKYLGGDVKHTHLVKGLDFALLQKVRQEIQQTTKEEEEAEAKQKAAEEARKREEASKKKGPIFQTPVGQRVHELLFASKKKTVDTFLPGRMCYVIHFDELASATEIPTTRYRPRSSLDGADDRHSAACDATLLQNITVICADRRKGLYGTIKDRKRREAERERQKLREQEKKRLEEESAKRQAAEARRQEQKRNAAPVEPIFPEAGDYNPDVPTDGASKSKPSSASAMFPELAKEREREARKQREIDQSLRQKTEAYAKQVEKSAAAEAAEKVAKKKSAAMDYEF